MAAALMRKQNLNTPQSLWARLYIIWSLDVLLLLAAIVCAQVHRGALQTIGRDAAPSIKAAQQIKVSLAAMDADIANQLLGAKDGDYELQRTNAATALIAAARNITYGLAEQQPIEAIQVNMGIYDAKAQYARDMYEWGDPGYVDAYRASIEIMNTELTEADKLDAANNQQLQATYGSQSGRSIGSLAFVLLTAAGLLIVLVAAQSYLNRKTRRVLNPMLVASTLLTLGFVLYVIGITAAERSDLKVAKEDAFESMHSLLRTKALAYAANTDESRYLLDPKKAAEYEQAFQQKAATVEKGATKQALAAWDRYIGIDRQIRDLETHGKHAQAIALCLGTNAGESNWAFEQFDKAIDARFRIDEDQFTAGIDEGFATLAHFELKAVIFAAVIALLAFAGLLQRIKEYR